MACFLVSCIVLFCFQSPEPEIEPDISLRLRKVDSTWVVKGINLTYGYIDLLIKQEEKDSLIARVVIPPLDSLVILKLGPGERKAIAKAFNDQHTVDYYLGGDPKATKHDDNYLYILPFKKDKKYKVTQGFNGNFTHNSNHSRYAIDFQLEIGEPVHAAREGIVIKVEEEFTKAGGKELLYEANRIIILHDDGTTASYVHLDYQGSLVEEGDEVARGQLIGYLGNTGYTRGPHLHFVVRKEDDLAIPIYFEGYPGLELRKNKKYYRK